MALRPTRVSLVVLGCAAAIGGAACGGASSDVSGNNPGDGKQIFSDAGCGGCHTFKPADSGGTSGPSLDNTSMTEQQIADQIATGGGGMPAFQGDLTQSQIDAVAAFIAEAQLTN